MNIYAMYHESHGFIGFYASTESSKSFTREFVDIVICDGKEGSCDYLARYASMSFNHILVLIMKDFGWRRVKELDSYGYSFSGFAFERDDLLA